jgi:hypothetical protein
MLSQYLAQPREGHLDQVFHIFGYLKVHGRSKVVFDDTFISWTDKFTQCDWQDFYPDAKEPIPGNMPEPRGKEVQLNAFVDANHAGDQVTRRSRTGVLIFVNKAPVLWFLKRQNTVETSTFGSEFVAIKIATELLIGLRYRFGICCDEDCDGAVDWFAVQTSNDGFASGWTGKCFRGQLISSYQCVAIGVGFEKETC